jgi:hypothetical protein
MAAVTKTRRGQKLRHFAGVNSFLRGPGLGTILAIMEA